jgi:hypothetical protein
MPESALIVEGNIQFPFLFDSNIAFLKLAGNSVSFPVSLPVNFVLSSVFVQDVLRANVKLNRRLYHKMPNIN